MWLCVFCACALVWVFGCSFEDVWGCVGHVCVFVMICGWVCCVCVLFSGLIVCVGVCLAVSVCGCLRVHVLTFVCYVCLCVCMFSWL